jgi:crotonobetainyl-CoA:carnitine CoA-transferase CaiB-like acyl-CoA transferase
VPCGPINSLDGAFGLAGALGLPSIVEITRADGTPARQVANPLQMSDTPVTYQLAPPELDADRAAVLALLASRG